MSDKFNAKVVSGTVHDRTTNVSRQGRWIPAGEIPLQHLHPSYGSPSTNPLHPHNIPGMSWCLDTGGWRNMKNARSHEENVQTVQIDRDDSRIFYL